MSSLQSEPVAATIPYRKPTALIYAFRSVPAKRRWCLWTEVRAGAIVRIITQPVVPA